MKSERRHELQHNTLADGLAKSLETIKPYQNVIFAFTVVIVVAAIGYTWWSRQLAAQTCKAWDEVNFAVETNNLDILANVADRSPNSEVGQTAMVVLADFRLAAGCDGLFKNKATALEELTKAENIYRTALSLCKYTVLLQRSTFGLARTLEARGDLPAAEKLYQQLVDKWPKGTYTGAAKERLADLKQPATKGFYDRFAHFDPKPELTGEPDPSQSIPATGSQPADKTDLKIPAEPGAK